jgi:hypothetical protein
MKESIYVDPRVCEVLKKEVSVHYATLWRGPGTVIDELGGVRESVAYLNAQVVLKVLSDLHASPEVLRAVEGLR